MEFKKKSNLWVPDYNRHWVIPPDRQDGSRYRRYRDRFRPSLGSLLVGTPASGGPAPSVDFTYTVAGVGNIIFCGIWNGAGDNLSVSNTPNALTWNAVAAKTILGDGTSMQLYWAATTTTGSTTISAVAQFGDDARAVIAEFSGTETVSPLETPAIATGNSTTPDSGAFTTSITDLLVGFVASFLDSPVVSGSWVSAVASTTLLLEYQNDKVAGSYHATGTVGVGAEWGAIGVGVKLPVGGGARYILGTH